MTSLLPFFSWCNDTAIGQSIRGSTWMFPVIEAAHLLALTVLLGSITIMSLRLIGGMFQQHSISELSEPLGKAMTLGILAIVSTGVPLFLSEANKCYENTSFRYKMVLLGIALLFHFTLFRSALSSERLAANRVYQILLGTFALSVWFSVGIAGRAIGLLG